MKLIIVQFDNIVILNNKSRSFDLTLFHVPVELLALRWEDDHGEIEYNSQCELLNEKINVLPEWTTPIIQKHEQLTQEEEKNQLIRKQKDLYTENGFYRIKRQKKQTEIKQQKQQKFINNYVRSKI